MKKERIGVISASILGIVALFLPWVSVDLGWGMGFSFNVFNMIELATWGYGDGTSFAWVGILAILLFVASLITSAIYERLSPIIPHLKIVPLIVSLIALLLAIIVVIFGGNALSPMSLFDFREFSPTG